MDATQVRDAFKRFFTERGHTRVASSGLIPHHPAAPLLTNAGMVQFIPVFLGEEPPSFPCATSVQKCFRTADIDLIGTTTRHLTFFEMLGNFSFGDYFKERAIPLAWELLTGPLGLDPGRLWATVHTEDDEAERIWTSEVGLPSERVQRLGEDNFWEMQKGAPGPCGPSSELYFDKGESFGPSGGPARGGPERYVEVWNLVFMQYQRQADSTLVDLPRRNIDTGAGLERLLAVLQGVDSVFETDVLRPLVAAGESVTGRRYGEDLDVDVSLRILADHGRAMAFLVSDGVFPSNEDRGYVLRRVIRRAVRHAFRLGVERLVTPELVQAVIGVMGNAHPELARNAEFVGSVVAREEQRFRDTLRAGSAILDEELAAAGDGTLSGTVAFKLHDTFGFPIELTREIAAERGLQVDAAGFEGAMAAQRRRAKDARKSRAPGEQAVEAYRDLLAQFGPTEFTGYREVESRARILAVIEGDAEVDGRRAVEVFLDRTPFYAEGGGQVGDTGALVTPTGRAEVTDTTYAIPGLHRHHVRIADGTIEVGQEATAAIDVERRDAIRRNHTATHLLHWALREVLGSHVRQEGSHVAPERLRFDFSHYGPVGPEQLAAAEAMANERVLANEPVRAFETSREEAERLGAMAFFGDKYGEVVRVVEAGDRSRELCGGTHVDALGTIGPIRVVSEGSIGANMRRIEALTGHPSLAYAKSQEETLGRVAALLKAAPEDLADRLNREIESRHALERQLEEMRRRLALGDAESLAREATGGVLVARRDGVARDELRQLAVALRDQPGVSAVVLGGAVPGGGVALVAAVHARAGVAASDLILTAARMVGGGGGRSPDVAMAGGKDPSRLDEALEEARRTALEALSSDRS
ncbi:MAG: alanine--tRNA ligase [Acidimicrobiales bacterium]